MSAIIIIIALFCFLGIILSSGKGSFLIAGFNTMSEKEKEKYDAVALSKFMGKMMFALSFSMVFFVISEAIGVKWVFIVGLILFIGIFIFTLFYTNKWGRFKK